MSDLDAIAVAMVRIQSLGVDTSTIPPDVLRRLVNDSAVMVVQTNGSFTRWGWFFKEQALSDVVRAMGI